MPAGLASGYESALRSPVNVKIRPTLQFRRPNDSEQNEVPFRPDPFDDLLKSL
jgi:hypothetical protein